MNAGRKTVVGTVDERVLAFTAGQDVRLDAALVEADCIGTAAHVTMLSRLAVRPKPVSPAELRRVTAALGRIVRRARGGDFRIRLTDQDVHLAVERYLSEELGALGRKVHLGRSRNDQIAVDLRLYAREHLVRTGLAAVDLARLLLRKAGTLARVPMVGRTHWRPAMPASVGLWLSAWAEDLLDDADIVVDAYRFNDRCPLGSAAGYGVPIPLDRELTARLLGFRGPVHNVLYAANARGKCESVVLFALAQVMLTLSRLAQDLILFSAPEFGYFRLPAALGTGSSIMPQKNNPDVLELVRARASATLAAAHLTAQIAVGLPSGYNRDLQETKGPLLEGFRTAAESLEIMALIVRELRPDRAALRRGFRPEVFAADRAIELAFSGLPFRDAYRRVKETLAELAPGDPVVALTRKTHLGAPGNLGLERLRNRARETGSLLRRERRRYRSTLARLLPGAAGEKDGK